MFLAGYFTRNWERLRDLREKRIPGGRVARAEHVLPVLVATGISLVLFFVLKDLGPALVTLFVFLAMFTRGARPSRAGDRGSRPDGGGGRRRLSRGDAAHRGAAHRYVALPLGQRRPRRRSAGARALGLRHRRPHRQRPGMGRSGRDSGGQHRPGAAGDRRRVGLCRRRGGLRAVRRF